jgi:enoyl-CoA hydratase/carnithine racemase
VLNALDAAATTELETVWQPLELTPELHAIVLTGAGDRAFCAGADMRTGSDRTGLGYWAHAHPSGFGGLSFPLSLRVRPVRSV